MPSMIWKFLMAPFTLPFYFLFNALSINRFCILHCRWLDLNCGPQISEATTSPTGAIADASLIWKFCEHWMIATVTTTNYIGTDSIISQCSTFKLATAVAMLMTWLLSVAHSSRCGSMVK